MKVIGIAGGIGSGKSTVTEYLVSKGFIVLDADKIAREITEKGSPVLELLANVFGEEILDEGQLDRKVLRRIVFSDVKKREKLDEITHREIKALMLKRINEISESFNGEKAPIKDWIFIDAPLLFEAKVDEMTDENWLVFTPDNVRIARAMERDKCLEKEVMKVMNHQMPEEEKKKHCQIILDNSGTKEELFAQVDRALTI